MATLPLASAAVSQLPEFEKSSVRIVGPRPGCISGVGDWVASVWGEGVADGGNQTMVAEGGGVPVGAEGVTVGNSTSRAEHEVRRNVIIKTDDITLEYPGRFITMDDKTTRI